MASDGRDFAGKSRPVDSILVLHRARCRFAITEKVTCITCAGL